MLWTLLKAFFRLLLISMVILMLISMLISMSYFGVGVILVLFFLTCQEWSFFQFFSWWHNCHFYHLFGFSWSLVFIRGTSLSCAVFVGWLLIIIFIGVVGMLSANVCSGGVIIVVGVLLTVLWSLAVYVDVPGGVIVLIL